MKNVLKVVGKGNRKKLIRVTSDDILQDRCEGIDGPIESQHMLIALMVPQAVKAFMKDLEKEVNELCGDRYKHESGGEYARWGKQGGSIFFGNQAVACELVVGTSELKGGDYYRNLVLGQFPFQHLVVEERLKKTS